MHKEFIPKILILFVCLHKKVTHFGKFEFHFFPFEKNPLKNNLCLFVNVLVCEALLENHVIPHVMCLPVITEEYKAKSVGSAKLGFDCDERGHSVENKRLAGDFILGDNGVVYMIDDVIIPDRGT